MDSFPWGMTYGNNLRKISKICQMDIDDLSTQIIKNNVKYRNLPENIAGFPSWMKCYLQEKTTLKLKDFKGRH